MYVKKIPRTDYNGCKLELFNRESINYGECFDPQFIETLNSRFHVNGKTQNEHNFYRVI